MSDNTQAPSASAEGQVAAPQTAESTQEASAEQKEAAKVDAQAAKKYKLKFDNEDEEVDEEKLLQYAQKYKGSEKKFQEAAKMRKDAETKAQQAEEILAKLRDDPLSILRDPAIGADTKKMLDRLIEEELKEMELSPEQKKSRDIEREYDKLKKQYEEEKSTREKERMQAEEQAYFAKTETDIVNAISQSSLPKAPYVAKRVIDVMMTAIDMGKECSAAQATAILEGSLRNEFESMDDAALERLMGEKIMKRLTKTQVRRIQESKPKAPPVVKTEDMGKKADSDKKEAPKGYRSPKDVFKLY